MHQRPTLPTGQSSNLSEPNQRRKGRWVKADRVPFEKSEASEQMNVMMETIKGLPEKVPRQQDIEGNATEWSRKAAGITGGVLNQKFREPKHASTEQDQHSLVEFPSDNDDGMITVDPEEQIEEVKLEELTCEEGWEKCKGECVKQGSPCEDDQPELNHAGLSGNDIEMGRFLIIAGAV